MNDDRAAFRVCPICRKQFYMRKREGAARWSTRQYCSRKCGRAGNVVIEPLEARLDKWSIPVTESGCWIWIGHDNPGGYGAVRVGRKMLKAHRVAWMVHRGPIPKGMCVLHKCDVRPCINPDHLFLGTYADNSRDMIAKGRHWSQK
jgi:hypothetical protein